LLDAMRVVFFSLLLLRALTGAPPGWAAGAPEDIRRWISEVTLGTEYGDAPRVVTRWTRSPVLSVFGANDLQAAVVRHAVQQINGALAGTAVPGIQLGLPNNKAAEIHVHFAPLREFERLARDNGFPYQAGNDGYFAVFWNQRHELIRARVLLASDRLRGPRLLRLTLEEITQCLGLANDSELIPDSIFYAGRRHGPMTQLSELDKRLIRFLYTAVPPGTTEAQLHRAIARSW
jgi:hypothetical protein